MMKMRTNQNYTFEALGGYLMNNNSVNAGSLADNIEVTCDNDRTAYEFMTNNRHSVESVAKMWICTWVNAEIRYCYGHEGYYCTYKQIKRFNELHNNSLDEVMRLLCDYIKWERKELAAEN